MSQEGRLLVVVGPSGVGKDSLIAYARDRLEPDSAVLFVRRVITREAMASAEDHDTLSPEAFAAAESAGAFAVTWQAHGLSYAIPIAAARHVAEGGVAVVNGSRAALPAIRAAFGRILVVHVTCRPEVLSARLAARGREDAVQQQQRLQRSAALSMEPGAIVVDNSGDLFQPGEALVTAIGKAGLGLLP